MEESNKSLFTSGPRFFIAVLVAFIIFGNHYTRDAPGALEKQLENELGFSTHEYSLLNSIYFIPNIVTPLMAGIFIRDLGGVPKAFLLSTIVAAAGHLVVGMGVEMESKIAMFAGKILAGSMYEILDALMPIIYLSPIFKHEFPIVVGVLQVFLRSGSIVNFFLSPAVYYRYGLKASFWLATIIGCTAVPLFLAARYLEVGSLSLAPSDEDAEGNEKSKDESAHDPEAGTDAAHAHSPVPASRICPAGGYGLPFYCYTLAGAFLYGGIVPFWFFGSKYLQDTFSISVTMADRILAVPEFMVVVVGIPVGYSLSYLNWSLYTKSKLLTAFMIIMAVSYGALLLCGIHAEASAAANGHDSSSSWQLQVVILSVIGMGIGFSVACSIFWALISAMVDAQYLSTATGIISCAVNLLPSIVPPIITWLMTYWKQHTPIIIIASLTAVGAVCSACMYFTLLATERREAIPQDEEGEDAVRGKKSSRPGGIKKQKEGGHYEMVPINELPHD